ncbi:polyprenol monophosphomannose synthase [Streptomyces sp. NPDC020472]|uniref:polyprenol monophosphomannose synthase n=1 Tax=Streptomyces sp. NPDC020472 TaxID=3365075 RepID=UPI00378A4D59
MAVVPPKTVVVVPTYNERDNLPVLAGLLADLPVPNLHLLVVDDDSPDGTGEVADKLVAGAPDTIGVLHRRTKDGLGRAYLAGMARALDEGADVVVQMDADLSHPASAIPVMLDALLTEGVAAVIGSRYVAGGSTASEWPRSRRALSAWANLYVNAILRLGLKDATAGFKAWRAETLRALDLNSVHSNGYSFQVEMNHRAVSRGFALLEVPIRFEERGQGTSKMDLGVQLESALTPWRLRFGGGHGRDLAVRRRTRRGREDGGSGGPARVSPR